MNEQAGPACALSVLIVGVFAVLLHDKDRSGLPPRSGVPSVKSDAPEPRDREPPRSSPPPASRLETTLVAPAPTNPAREPQVPRAETAGTSRARESPGPGDRIAALEDSTGPREPVPGNPERAARPRGDFTVVGPGETLADVAERVYGSSRATESLWKANRDQLAGLETPLPKGTLLRTP